MKKIEDLTTEELKNELQRRKEMEDRPKVKEDVDLEKLISYTEDHIESVINGTNRQDADHYIYQETMETLYGEGFFDWFNETNKNG